MKSVRSYLLSNLMIGRLFVASVAFQNGNNHRARSITFVVGTISSNRITHHNGCAPRPNGLHSDCRYSSRLYAVPSISSDDVKKEENNSNIVWLKKRFDFSGEALHRLSVSTPQLLTLDKSVMGARAHWLQKRLKITSEGLKTTIRRCPLLLCSRSEAIGAKVDLLEKRLGCKTKTVAKLVQRQPTLLMKNLARKFHWIEKRFHLTDDTEKMRKVVVTCPGILCYSIHDILEPKLEYLQARLELTELQLVNFVLQAPRLFQSSITAGIEPKLDLLRNYLDLDSVQLGTMIRRRPMILTLSLDNLQSKLQWLSNRLHLTNDHDTLREILLGAPTILAYSITRKVEPTLQWLQERLRLESDCDVGKFIAGAPTIVGLSIATNLAPTLEFFVEESGGEDEAIDLVLRQPFLLTASLERRLKPRIEQARQAGIEITPALLVQVARSTEEDWITSIIYQSKNLLAAAS